MISENNIHALTGRSFSCLLFDVGNTLWRKDPQRLPALELVAQQQAAGIARRFSASTPLATCDDVSLGRTLHEEILRQFQLAITHQPGIEPTGEAMVKQAFKALELEEAITKSMRLFLKRCVCAFFNHGNSFQTRYRHYRNCRGAHFNWVW
ncbi:hypothetical protein [Dictyobacter vulcani]|uniref:hypothetical protein n=1 Tax=Dictyobacter vulcani TaxID=2607529 RepID=UPI00124FD891|nr:hypothetical protein [Dictyobacter vulcani]